MSKIINLGTKNKTVLSSTYYMNYAAADGKCKQIELTGEETFSTTCPACEKPFSMEFQEFCSILGIEGNDIFGTSVYCVECSKKRQDGNINGV